MPEVEICLRIIERIGEIPDPAKSIGIYINGIMPDKGRTVFHFGYIPVAIDNLSYILPGIVSIVIYIFGLCCLLVVNPEIGVVQLSYIDLFLAVEPLLRGIEHLFKYRSSSLFPGVDPFSPVQNRRVDRIAVVINHKILTVGNLSFSQLGPENGIPDIINKLTILVIGYFSLVHPECLNCNCFGDAVHREDCILIARTHRKTARGYKSHLERFRFEEIFSSRNSGQFSVVR